MKRYTLFPQYGTARREEERPSGRLRQAGKRCPLGEHAHEKRRRNIVRIRERQSDQEGEGRVGQQHQRKDDACRDVSEDPYRGVEGGYPGKIEAVQAYGEVDQKVYQVPHQQKRGEYRRPRYGYSGWMRKDVSSQQRVDGRQRNCIHDDEDRIIPLH